MHDLRLIGVREDGEHILLVDDDGERYCLALDDALRAAARRDRPRLGQLQIEIEGGLRPREVQALVRRGLSTEEVAERAGWTVEKVRRFEGPVLAEREFLASQAQRSRLGVGPVSQTLATRVEERLRGRGVERDGQDWDAWREDNGQWIVALDFPAGGHRRRAQWAFDHLGGTVVPLDDEARWLSEDAPAQGPIPTPHMAVAVGESAVYDIEASGGLVERSRPRPRARSHEPIDLLAAMREQNTRGRRRRRHTPNHVDEPREDALPIEELALDLGAVEPPPVARDLSRLAPSEEVHVADAFGPEVTEPIAAAQPHDDVEDSSPTPKGRRAGRPQLPSWDDIVFGGRAGDE